MMLRLPGMSCEDRFAVDLAQTLGTRPVHLVMLSPGREFAEAFASLAAWVRKVSGPALESTREVGRCQEITSDFLSAVTQALGWVSTDPTTIESLILANVERLTWPCVVCVPVAAGTHAPKMQHLLHIASEMAEVTKNLSGPLTFVVVTSPDIELPAEAVPNVWEPLYPWPDPLPFWKRERSLQNAGFDIYLAHRIYWEAAGQPRCIEHLVEVYRLSSRLMIASDADGQIDGAFDHLWAYDETIGEHLADFFERAFDPVDARAVLKTGIVRKSKLPLWQLLTTGLAWYPPGSPQACITPNAARHLSKFPRLGCRSGVGADGMSLLRRAARRNQPLALWALNLTMHVEREMVTLCQHDISLDRKLDQLALKDKLIQERERTPRNLAYDVRDDLIDYASFGDLQALVTQTELERSFPVSAVKLNQIRQTRNLSAHLHPVTWQGVRNVLTVIDQLHVF
jgi:hypothetical protein